MRDRLGVPAPTLLALGIAGVLALPCAHAQQAPAPDDAYRDRIIAPQQLQDLPPDDEEEDASAGAPRSYHAEAIASRNERGDDSFDEQGVSVGGYWETQAWGSLSLDATVFHTTRDRFDGIDDGAGDIGGAATLWQRNLYVDGGWLVNNGVGVLNTPLPPLQRNQYRFFLPTVAFAGASSEWENTAGGVTLQGAFGRAGLYTGTRVTGFDMADGSVSALGAQWTWSPGWTGAASFLGTQGKIVPDSYGEPLLTEGDTRAVYASTAWEDARNNVQFNLLGSDGDIGHATGGWVDAFSQRGRFQHNSGGFYLQPGLAWGALPINNDVEGGYYRVAYQYARWSWNAGLDVLRSLSGDSFDGEYATGYARYQATSSLGYGGSLNVRHSQDSSYGMQAFVDRNTRWGESRLQVDQASASGNSDSWQVMFDQAFPLHEGSRLSASVAYGSLHYDGADEPTATTIVALYGGRDLTGRLSIDGTARWTHGNGEGAIRGADINIGINWNISARWSLNGAFYQSQGSQRSPFIIDPLVTETPFISLPRDRSVFLSLRYERNAGHPQAVVGGAPNGPTGAVAGSVYLDDNGDGVRSASEQPAVNVTVLLDGRFAARTDSLGNFEFPRVATGRHTLTVIPDNLPLPWFIDEPGGQQPIEVHVRQATRVDIGARRQH
ncbi:MAG: carboxypeptidase-like regulatory domain-containing protein [Luteimonas sp.]